MEDKLDQFFSQNNFDVNNPNSGHEMRFEKKLNYNGKHTRKKSWKWLSVAASFTLLIGFWLGNFHQKQQLEMADISPKMKEVENYFVSAIHQELKTVEKNRSLKTETIIEEALEQLEELEDDFKLFVQQLNTDGNSKKIINAMIKNYQQRLQVLENVLQQIEQIKNPNTLNNEIYI